ncbi:unnamed protein product [Rotaria sordida]|uniref:Uncharacterized protein n=1 Tax=Rotaria sordida TaxID=392033 RepID=A0A818GHB9_9BILA|nr:unnamed protein product [Rotaria sordida]CAF0874802.1 unnamed protein product [Rotaria sordida]CAF3489220.1 unnamed protein product [Rotaria sordida]
MNILLVYVFILFNVSQYQCETPSCKTNCTTIEECWHEALAYRSSELIEQLFSFSSLSVHIDTFQRHHPGELNDSILLVDNALENHLLNESIVSKLNINLFQATKQLLIDLCTNLTLKPIETVEALPTLMCSLSTCSSDLRNFMVLFIISILIASLVLLICIVQLFQTYRRVYPAKKIPLLAPSTNQLSIDNSTVNLNSSGVS